MADDIQKPGPGQAVTSVTEVVPHDADSSSEPGPYKDLSVDRPPVSTSDAQTPIAHSLVAGAGASHPPEPEPEQEEPEEPKPAKAKASK